MDFLLSIILIGYEIGQSWDSSRFDGIFGETILSAAALPLNSIPGAPDSASLNSDYSQERSPMPQRRTPWLRYHARTDPHPRGAHWYAADPARQYLVSFNPFQGVCPSAATNGNARVSLPVDVSIPSRESALLLVVSPALYFQADSSQCARVSA
jgi:hypothetical protein